MVRAGRSGNHSTGEWNVYHLRSLRLLSGKLGRFVRVSASTLRLILTLVGCTLQNLLFGTCFYSATLALYFVSIIRFEKKERWFAKWVEPVGHFLAIGYPLTSGTVAIIYDFMNPLDILPGWCWISEFPTNCSNEDHVECLRGGDPKPGMGILVAGPLLFLVVFLMILACMLLIYFKVRETERRMEQYTGNEDRGYERTKEVGRQAILYIAAFLLTYMPIAGTMFCRKSHAAAFVFAVMVKTLSTLQGFFNSIIFLRNQYRTLTSQGQSLYFLRRLAQMTPQQRSFKPSPNAAATKHSDVPVTSNQTVQSHKTVKETEPVVFSDRVGSESEQPFWRIKPEQAESSTGPPETLQSDA